VNSDLSFDDEILKILSTKTDKNQIFPPYIPFIGKNFDKYKILIYSTAQNIDYNSDFRKYYQKNIEKLNERLCYFNNFKYKYPENKITFTKIDINPYRTGVLPALLGVLIFAVYDIKIYDFDEITDLIGITNYYKFSLNSGKDINPETKIFNFVKDKNQVKNYWRINDKLVEKEIEFLNPKYIISFSGRKIEKLRKIANDKTKIIQINDPSWILQGGGGVFSENGKWTKNAKKFKDLDINELVNHYSKFLNGKYENKKQNVKTYLLNYYSIFKINNEQITN